VRPGSHSLAAPPDFLGRRHWPPRGSFSMMGKIVACGSPPNRRLHLAGARGRGGVEFDAGGVGARK